MKYGLWCEQHGYWLKAADGRILYYDDPIVAEAHRLEIDSLRDVQFTAPQHLWRVTEIGKESTRHPLSLPPGSRVCGAAAEFLTFA